MMTSAVVAGDDHGSPSSPKVDKSTGVVSVSSSQKQSKGSWNAYEDTNDHCAKTIRPFFAGFIYPLRRRLPCFGYKFTYSEVFVWAPLAAALVAASAVAGCGGAGELASIPLALTFMTASHNSVFTFLFGIPFERALTFHKACGWLAVISGALHGLTQCDTNATGFITLALIAILIISSLHWFRRRVFELFYWMHIPLFIVLIPISIIHGAKFVIIGVVFWIIDIIIRSCLMTRRFAHEGTVTVLPANVVRLVIDKSVGNFRFRAGQFVFICLPEISMFEWHPFSISSAPEDESVSLHIRVLGNWTQKLQDLAVKKRVDGQPTTVKLWVEGPYGDLQVDLHKNGGYKTIIMISGGIGITPLQSICNDIMDQYERGRPLHKIFFVWSCADRFLLDAMYDREYLETKALPLTRKVPKSFQPMLLRRLSADGRLPSDAQPDDGLPPPSPLLTELYLTRVRNEAEFEAANINPSLQEWVKMGRPDLSAVFARAKQAAITEGDSHVAVLVCGPQAMIDDVRRLSGEMSDRQVAFDYHSETFEF